MTKKSLILCLLFISMISFVPIEKSNGAIATPSVLTKDDKISWDISLSLSDSIVIEGDEDFEAQGWPGAGSAENPYVIENMEIASEYDCVHIADTTAFFVIQDCQFVSGTESGSPTAIFLDNVTNGCIQQCSMTGCIGMRIVHSSNMNISRNEIHSFASGIESYGLDVVESVDCLINENQFNGEGVGLEFHMSDNCSATNNVLTGCGLEIFWVHNPMTPSGHGLVFDNNSVNSKKLQVYEGLIDITLDGSEFGQLWLFTCHNVTIIGGDFNGATRGIVFSGCTSCSINGSTITNCVMTGIKFYECIDCNISKCIIRYNGKMWSPGAYEAGGIFIDDYSGISILDSDISFNYGSALYGKDIVQSVIDSNHIESNGGMSFLLEWSDSCEIQDNIFIEDSLFIKGVSSNMVLSVSNNTVNGKPLGYFVNLHDTSILGSNFGAIILVNSSMVNIYDGKFIDAFHGIQLIGCVNCELHNITVTGQTGYAISITNSESCKIIDCFIKGSFKYGMFLIELDDLVLENNIVHGCIYGVDLVASNSLVTRNILAYCGVANLYMTAMASSNQIYENRFGRAGDVPVYDYGAGNKFDDGVNVGNEWSGYKGEGQYEVPGSAGSVDHYPKVLTATSPASINDIDDIVFEQGNTGHSIDWNIDALYNASFYILKNGTKVDEGTDTSITVIIQLDGLATGTYNYTIVVTDIMNSVAIESVLVSVIERNETTTTTSSTSTSTTGGADPFIVVILAMGGIAVITILAITLKSRET